MGKDIKINSVHNIVGSCSIPWFHLRDRVLILPETDFAGC